MSEWNVIYTFSVMSGIYNSYNIGKSAYVTTNM